LFSPWPQSSRKGCSL